MLDAGYFDNYGMSIALGYLKQASVLAWLKENTSGVILIQINAFATPQAVEDTVEDRCREPLAGPSGGALGRAFTSLTSPIAGLVNSRGASMVFRNELELDSLKQLFGQTLDNDRNPLRFDSIMFENAARASFSWYLPQGDLACMREQLNGQRFAGEFTKLTQAWDAWTANVTSANDVDPVPPEPQ